MIPPYWHQASPIFQICTNGISMEGACNGLLNQNLDLYKKTTCLSIYIILIHNGVFKGVSKGYCSTTCNKSLWNPFRPKTFIYGMLCGFSMDWFSGLSTRNGADCGCSTNCYGILFGIPKSVHAPFRQWHAPCFSLWAHIRGDGDHFRLGKKELWNGFRAAVFSCESFNMGLIEQLSSICRNYYGMVCDKIDSKYFHSTCSHFWNI